MRYSFVDVGSHSGLRYSVRMALDKYRAKRNFDVSPEPRGKTPKAKGKGKPLFFCVQKHLASHLHYDFRIEHDGVLLSWAVPKGPSLDPSVKRLAMHVEDHPLEYGTFEGIIPEGYGAGIVLLWDEGTWEPLVDDVSAAIKKGDLKLRLNGVKLKGSWALVRTGGSGGDGRSWLLLKHRDEWSGPIDIAVFAPLSVKSGGNFTDVVSKEAPNLWQSNRKAKGVPTDLMKIVERAVAHEEELKKAASGDQTSPPAPTKASAKARSRPRTPAASGRAARSPASRSRSR
jgi:bifunctional non-homologous end joining protein LigD